MKFWTLLPYFVLTALVGFWFGWGAAHITVAKELDRLGAFYVGKEVYEGKRRE